MPTSFGRTSIIAVAAVTFGMRANADLKQGAAAAAQAAVPVAMMAAVSSGGFAAAARAPCASPNLAVCAMMALAVVQVGMALLQKNGDKASASGLTTGYGSSAGNANVESVAPNSSYATADGTKVTGDTARTANALAANGFGGLANDYVSAAKAAAASGVTASADGSTVTFPNGKKVSSSAFSSPQAMKDAGFSGADVSGAQNFLANTAPKAVAAATAKIGSLTNDVGGGGSGSGSASAGGGGGGGGFSDGGMGKFGKGLGGKKESNVSGLSKKFGSDNIGVSGDDIFEMITRRYQARDKVDTFLKN